MDAGRVITETDVNELTAMVAEAEIFKMVNSLAEGRGDVALKMLHGLLNEKDEDPFRIFGMIVRQFRLLLTAKEYITATGSSNGMNTALGMAPFVAKKLTSQARGLVGCVGCNLSDVGGNGFSDQDRNHQAGNGARTVHRADGVMMRWASKCPATPSASNEWTLMRLCRDCFSLIFVFPLKNHRSFILVVFHETVIIALSTLILMR